MRESRDNRSALCPWGFPAGPEAELNLSTCFRAEVGFVAALQRFGKGLWLEQRAVTVTDGKNNFFPLPLPFPPCRRRPRLPTGSWKDWVHRWSW